MKRLLSLLLASVLLVPFIVGCTPTESETTSVTGTEAAASDSDTTAEPGLDVPDDYGFAAAASTSTAETLEYNFAGAKLSDVTAESTLKFCNGTEFTCGESGLICPPTGWDSVGIYKSVGKSGYTADAYISAAAGDNPADTAALGVGVRCKTAEHLFIDSGLWVMCRDSQMYFTVKDGFSVKVALEGVNFAEGVLITVVDSTDKISFYYTPNGGERTLAAYAVLSDSLTLYAADETRIAATESQPLPDSGYFRCMSHYTSGGIKYMKLNVKEPSLLYASTDITYFKTGTFYGFCGLYKHDNNAPQTAYTFEENGKIYTTAEFLASALGFALSSDGGKLTLSYGGNTLVFTPGKGRVEVNGTLYGASAPIEKDGEIYLDAESFANIIGYTYEKDGEYGYMCSPAGDISSYKDLAAQRYQLYDTIIFNYDNVDCDMTGTGKYDPVAYEDRLVGIAYTTWFTKSWNWSGSSTWDIPLLGGYLSDDRDVIRQHAEWLAYAGVDFIFIDWSNNIAYDPETMRTQREDFRMIEESVIDIFEVFAQVEGAPKICIFTGPGHYGQSALTNGLMAAKNDQIYKTFIENEEYNKMYFYYEGKPLLLCYGATPSFNTQNKALYEDDRFTMRWVTGFVGQQGSLCNTKTLVSKCHWSWEERGAQTFTLVNKTIPECMTVVASWRAQGSEGDNGYIAAGKRDNGSTFKTQWQRADEVGVKIVLIVSFNEWTTGEQESVEVSKDIEPSKTLGTFYLDLMKEQIKKFKGKLGT